MIESRYKIEYVLPDEDMKKSSPFKVLWYLLLIPLVLLAVIAITYDFSIKNIARDSSVLVEKAKIHIFNLGDNTEIKKQPIQTNPIVEKILIPKLKPVATSEQKIVTKKPLIDNKKDDKVISELTAKQEEQLKKIQEQISENKKLTQSLNSLSSELVIEKTRNDSLNSRLSEQEKDRLELEEQLNKVLAESENNDVLLKDFTEKEKEKEILKSVDIQSVKTIKNNNTIQEEAATDKKATAETVELNKQDNNIEELEIQKTELSKADPITPSITPSITPIKEEIEISETDKIINAMSSLESNKIKEEESNISKSESETKSDLIIEDSPKTPEKIEPKNNDILFAIGIEDKNIDEEKGINQIDETVNSISSSNVQKANITEQPSSDDISVNSSSEEDKKEVVKVKAETKTESTLESEKTISPPKPNSAVDAIVAAMQESQAKNKNSANQNIDLELEKDIKQQLVEQGDLSVDN